ncbi:DUF3429 domain-containing protein [Roseomonas sp. BN140053]|uniref:DUF3429 domain-containing protein n=1 Tax=Roseomonas sp. BN140053 TaxID=3391898 RepID=UPI0039E85E5A
MTEGPGGWRLPAAATLLGLAGLLPFAGLAALAAAGEDWARPWLVGYGASILSFLGAVHWGAALRAPEAEAGWDWPRFGLGVVPSLVAAVALQLQPATAAAVLAAAILLTAAGEAVAATGGAVSPRWVRLRWILSIGAGLLLLAGEFLGQ